jgi:hypothetical protein
MAVEFVIAFTGIVVIVFPTAALADATLGSPLGANVLLLTLVAGVVGATPYATRDWSFRRLARFVGVTMVSAFGWLVVVGAVLSLLSVGIPAGDRRPFLYAALLSLATAYVSVYSDTVELSLESGETSSFGRSS